MSTKNTPCGVECIFSQFSDVWILLSFFNIVLDHYYFSVVDASIFLKGSVIEVPQKIDQGNFQKFFQQACVGERLVLHLYPNGAPAEEIDSYYDFLHSNCEVIVLLYDVYYVEIYCKNPSWIQEILSEGKKIQEAIIKEKYVDTDSRTTMYV